MNRKRNKPINTEEKYMFVGLTNLILSRSGTNYECYITRYGTIQMRNINNRKNYTKNGMVLENKELIKTVIKKFLKMDNLNCYHKTCEETSLIYKEMLKKYLSA